MKPVATSLAPVIVIEPTVFGDERGWFYESWNEKRFSEIVGRDVGFVQDNHSFSTRGILRGLHYQIRQAQGKLVRVIAGEVFDVAVDLRRSSPTFGKWTGERLTGANRRMMWIPEGFAHGFVVLSESAEFLYKATDFYAPQHERTLLWNDPALGIDWQFEGTPLLKPKDAAGARLADAETFP